MAYTFSDGLTLASLNVTNDLVTGAEVAHVNAQTASGASLEITDTGEVEITAASTDIAAVNLNAAAGGFLASNDSGSRFVLGVAGDVQVTAAGGAGGDLTLAASNDLLVNLTRDETHTVGRNFHVSAAGAAGSAIDALNGNLTLDAGSVGGTGQVRIMPTAEAPAATRTFRIWDGVGETQQNGDIGPAGGSVIDVESRATLATLLDYFYAWGWITNPSP